jgi:hypothetical protein
VSLLDDLRAASGAIDPQFHPSSNETGPLLAALIVYTEHGDTFLKAASDEENPGGKVTELLAPAPDAGSDDAASDDTASSSAKSSSSSSSSASKAKS